MARSCSMARLGRAELLLWNGKAGQWHGRVPEGQGDRAENMPGHGLCLLWECFVGWFWLCVWDVFGNVFGVRSLAKRVAKALIPLDAPLRS